MTACKHPGGRLAHLAHLLTRHCPPLALPGPGPARALVDLVLHPPPPRPAIRPSPIARSIFTYTTPTPAPRAPDLARLFSTSTRPLGRVVDNLPTDPHHRALAARPPRPAHDDKRPHGDEGAHGADPHTASSSVLDALLKARARGAPWWWKVARAQVEAQDRHRSRNTHRPSAWQWRASPIQHAFSRAGPSAASTHDCHHSSPDHHAADPTSPLCFAHSSSSSNGRGDGRSGHAHGYRRGHDPASCAQPLSGCRASSSSWSWWYLLANERRRRDPACQASYVRHACHEWHDFAGKGPYGAAYARAHGNDDVGEGEGGCVGQRRAPRSCRREWDVLRGAQVGHARRRRGLALSHRARAHDGGGGRRSRSEGAGAGAHRSGPFDYEAFRRAHWRRLLNWDSSRLGDGPRGDGTLGRHRGPRWLRANAPHYWVRCAHRFRTRKNGALFVTWRACDSDALRVGAAAGDGGRRGRCDAGAVRTGSVRPQVEAVHARPHATRATPPSSSSFLGSSMLGAPARLALRAGAARLFSTSPRSSISFLPPSPTSLAGVCTPLELGLPLLLPLASLLKSTAALNVLSFVTRISLTLLPLSARSRILHALRERYLRDPTSLSASLVGRCALEHHARTLAAPSGFLARWNALLGLPLLVLTPLVLLALVALASLERTPITGRWRVVMLSPAEEADLVRSVLAPTSSPGASAVGAGVPAHAQAAPVPEGTSRDWVATLQRVLDLADEGRSPTTGRRRLLGGDVLDHRDWRVRWAEAVLRALEQGAAPGLAAGDGGVPRRRGPSVLAPPPTSFPLEPRAEALGEDSASWSDEFVLAKPAHAHSAHAHAHTGGHAQAPLRLEYDLLVVDRPDANAFSFGFGPDAQSVGSGQGPASAAAVRPRRGVIVVYTGFLDEILGRSTAPPALSSSSSASVHGSASSTVTAADPLRAHLAPTTLPTDAQTRQLAVLLAHELAHLALSHTLESYASSSLLVPHLARLTSDVLRTFLYPVTALLGPFINDALGRSLSEGAQGGFGVLAEAVNSCESRKLESEADVVALRLLATSGIDPHCALSFWEDRVAHPSSLSSSSSAPASTTHARAHAHTVRPHSTTAPESLLRSHPVDEERVERIRVELASWERWWASASAAGASAAVA
ncbi:hypothetical protein JCM3775_001758 [Rhodotorula graminis]